MSLSLTTVSFNGRQQDLVHKINITLKSATIINYVDIIQLVADCKSFEGKVNLNRYCRVRLRLGTVPIKTVFHSIASQLAKTVEEAPPRRFLPSATRKVLR